MLQDKILIICGNSIPQEIYANKNFKTIGLNNTTLSTDLVCYYSSDCFKIDNIKIIEERGTIIEYINESNADDYIKTENKITIKK